MPLIAWGSGVEPGTVREEFISLTDLLPTFLDLAGRSPSAGTFDGSSFAHMVSARPAPSTPWRTMIFATHDTHRVEPDIPSRSVRFGEWKYILNGSEGLRFENFVMRTSDTWRAMTAAADAGDVELAARMTRFVLRPVEELFDLSADPLEQTNLAGSPEYSAELAKGQQVLRESTMVTMPTRD